MAMLPIQAQPSNPGGTASATYVMMGLGTGGGAITFTPNQSGRMLIFASGDVTQNTTADGAQFQLSWGTGAGPANGAAVTGNQIGPQPSMTFLTGVLTVPFAVQSAVNLQVGVLYWFDIALKALTGGSASLSNLGITIIEV